MIEIIQSVVGSVLNAFLAVILCSILANVLDFLFPSLVKWTRMFVFIFVVLIVFQPAFEQFEVIEKITETIATMFISIYPILTISIVAAGGAFSLINFQPAMLLFANGAVYLSNHVLLPVLTMVVVFHILSHLQPEMPFTRMAELLRTALLGAVSAIVAAYSIFITTGGTMTWVMSSAASEPFKELIRQNVPLVGSFMTDSMGAIGKYTSGATFFVGGWIIFSIWSIALLPTLKTLLIGFLYRWTAALMEPFAHDDIVGLLDDIGKTLFVLCAVSFLVAFAFIYTALFSVILIKLLTLK